MSLRNLLKNAMPNFYRRLSLARKNFELISDTIKRSKGTYEIECSVCGFVGFFKAFGSPPRWNALCPSCGSLERHRQLALVLRDMRLTGSLLHFAPEESTATLLKAHPIQYFSADLYAPDVDLKLNIENIDLPGEQFDTIVCSHVLEHVNDRAALLEMRRILKLSGILIVMVPIIEGCPATYEDEAVTVPTDREVHFGQSDHVRVYGADFVERLASAGFEFQIHTAFGKDALRYGLLMGDKVFLCRKAIAHQTINC